MQFAIHSYSDLEKKTDFAPCFLQYLNSKVGDMRLSWSVNEASIVSILAVQGNDVTRNSFKPFVSSNGVEIYRLMEGKHTATEMHDQLAAENYFLTVLLRVVGFLLMWFGLSSVFSPLVALAEFIPMVGGVLGDLVGSTICCATCFLALFFSLTIIAVAWIAHRLVIAIPLFVFVVLAVVGFGMSLRKGREKADQRGDSVIGGDELVAALEEEEQHEEEQTQVQDTMDTIEDADADADTSKVSVSDDSTPAATVEGTEFDSAPKSYAEFDQGPAKK